MQGNDVATIYQRLIAVTPTYEIARNSQDFAEIRKYLFSLFIDCYIVEVPGTDDLEITGSLFEHEYIIARGGQTAATVSKQWLAMSATYDIDIATGLDDVLILACVLALDLAEDREQH